MRKIFIIIFVSFFLLPVPLLSFGEEKEPIADIAFFQKEGNFFISFLVNGCFNEKIREAIFNGISTTFSYYVNFRQLRRFWPDKELSSARIVRTVEYDNVKKKFKITFGNKQEEIITLYELSDLKKTLETVDSLLLASLDKLKKDATYCLDIKVESEAIGLPFYFNYILFFISRHNFETDWFHYSFTYPVE